MRTAIMRTRTADTRSLRIMRISSSEQLVEAFGSVIVSTLCKPVVIAVILIGCTTSNAVGE